MTELVDEAPAWDSSASFGTCTSPPLRTCQWRRASTEPCECHRRDVELTERIKEIHTASGGNYGSLHVYVVLKCEGLAVGRKRVERLISEADIAGGVSPSRKGLARRDPKATLAPGLVQRDFHSARAESAAGHRPDGDHHR
ncbi:IS3 family transposase [Streptomyces sp. NPDC058694]|uniref:IS3 family transposase n=1 Tax=Streptomyces sp. NPDC058694 TaxID=3346603 RepID=UPI00365688D9